MFSAKAKLGLGVVRSSAWLAAVFVFALNGQERGPARLSLAFSFGGSQTDRIFAIGTDAAQNIYVAGDTNSRDLPGAAAYSSSSTVAFVAKFDPSATHLLYTVILGGSNGDSARGIAVDSSGNAYVTGFTASSNFPVTAGALQSQIGSIGFQDAFVAKLSPTGALIYSTYLGGSSTDTGAAIAVDQTGAAYVTGLTNSVNFPVTSGAPQGSFGGGGSDCFVAKLNSAGSALSYSTYLGGNNLDECSGIAIDATEAAFVTGTTSSGNFPVAAALQPTQGSSFSPDAFLTKLSPAGTSFLFSTYLGGEGVDNGNAVQVDQTGNAYVGGSTNSILFPVTSGALQTQLLGTFNGFWCEVANDGSGILYATYLGGSGTDSITSLYVASDGRIVGAGFTTSVDFPTVSPIQPSFGGGFDGFVAVLSLNGTSLDFASYLGGAGDDKAYAITPGSSDTFVVAGQVMSQSVSYIPPRFSSPPPNQTDGFVAAIVYPGPPILPALVSFNPPSGSGLSQAFTAVYSSSAGGGDIEGTQVQIGGSLLSPPFCYFGYSSGSNQFLLLNDAGTAWLPTGIPAGSGSLSNSQCTVLGSGSSGGVSGNQLTVTYNIQFQPGFAGEKTIWTNAYSASSGLGSAWQSNTGGVTFSWTIGSPAPIVPTLISFTPQSGSGLSQAFTAVYSSSAGGGDIVATQVLINSSMASAQSCYFGYAGGNQFLLLNDAGTAWLPTTITAGSGSLTNSQCTILGSGSSASISGNQLTVIYNIQFQAGFAGQKIIWTNAYSSASGLGSAWQSNTGGADFSWTIGSSSAPTAPTLVSFAPVSGSGLTQAFTAVYSSSAGGGDIFATQVLINSSMASAQSCYFGYAGGNQFLLLNDAGTAWLPTTITSASGTLSNSQCTILGSGSSASIAGNQLTVIYNIQFQAGFAGQKTIWTNAYSSASGLGSAWQSNTGGANFSWAVP